MKPASFPPLLEQYNHEPIIWERFITIASKGSAKGVDIFQRAETALAIRIGGQRIYDESSLEEYYETLKSIFPVESPFHNLDSLLALLKQSHYFFSESGSLKQPDLSNNEELFDSLWKRQVCVDKDTLLYNAALYCFKNWNFEVYNRLAELLNNNSLNYNSLYLVSAMLFLLISEIHL